MNKKKKEKRYTVTKMFQKLLLGRQISLKSPKAYWDFLPKYLYLPDYNYYIVCDGGRKKEKKETYKERKKERKKRHNVYNVLAKIWNQ